jgi:aminopeptidase N
MWLSEGFSTYLQNLGVRHAKNNDSAVMDRFVLQGTQTALETGIEKLSLPN